MSGFQFIVESDVFLTVDEVWPDGDAPANPTASDALNALRAGTRRITHHALSDWGLLDGFEVSVIDPDGRVAHSSDPTAGAS